mgnify:CR=1 FL=1
MQDWGDGGAQEILRRRSAAIELIDAQLGELRKLPAVASLDASSYGTAVGVLRVVSVLVNEYERGAAAWAAIPYTIVLERHRVRVCVPRYSSRALSYLSWTVS